MLGDLLSPEAPLLGLQMTVFMLCPHVTFFLCTYIASISSSSYEDTSLLGEGPTFVTSFKLIISLKALSPGVVILGVRASTYEFGEGDKIQFITVSVS